MNPYFKLALFLTGTFFIVTKTGTADYTAADVATWQAWDWFQLVIGIGAAMAVQLLAFLDQSISSWQAERKLNGQNGKTP